MTNKKILAALLLSFVFLIFGAGFVYALAGPCEPCNTTSDCELGLECEKGKCRGCPTVPGQVVICNPLKVCDFQELVDKIIDFIFFVAIAIAPIMLIIAGFIFLTAGGNPQKISQAKSLILYTVIGFVVVLLAKGLIAILESVLGG